VGNYETTLNVILHHTFYVLFSTLSFTTLSIMKTITLFIRPWCLHLATTASSYHCHLKTNSKEDIQCTMCAACDNPCNQVSSLSLPSSTTNNCLPPPASPTSYGGRSSGGSYYYFPPPPPHS